MIDDVPSADEEKDLLATHRDPTAPSQPTIKRLFAHCGNRCAFPRCTAALVEGATVVGEICHIKGAKPGAPRHDARQTVAARHGYDNLLLLCSKHHTIIDDDEEAYTVERLLKMKADYESRAAPVDDDFAERVVQLLITHPVSSTNQSGGITAHTIKADIIKIHSPAVSVPARPQDNLTLSDLERPHILPDKLNPSIKECMYGPSAEKPSLTFSLRNYGRSPAVVSELRALLTRQPVFSLPGQPPFGLSRIPLNNLEVIGANDIRTYTCSDQYPISAPGERGQIERGIFRFWFFYRRTMKICLGEENIRQKCYLDMT
jgi:hypothetical protein